jgi:uncharacterized protein YndB with AHSA1/START domain
MRIVGRILLGILVLILATVITAYTLPRQARVVRSTDIAAPPAAIYAIVSDLRRFNEWSPWLELDPNAEFTFTGPVDGVGQTLNWESANPNMGAGSQVITRLEPDKAVEVDLNFGAMGPAKATFDIEPTAMGSLVTWGFTTDLGFNPVARYMGMMIDGWVGADFERGLTKLKAVAETASPTIPAPAESAPSTPPAAPAP